MMGAGAPKRIGDTHTPPSPPLYRACTHKHPPQHPPPNCTHCEAAPSSGTALLWICLQRASYKALNSPTAQTPYLRKAYDKMWQLAP